MHFHICLVSSHCAGLNRNLICAFVLVQIWVSPDSRQRQIHASGRLTPCTIPKRNIGLPFRSRYLSERSPTIPEYRDAAGIGVSEVAIPLGCCSSAEYMYSVQNGPQGSPKTGHIGSAENRP